MHAAAQRRPSLTHLRIRIIVALSLLFLVLVSILKPAAAVGATGTMRVTVSWGANVRFQLGVYDDFGNALWDADGNRCSDPNMGDVGTGCITGDVFSGPLIFTLTDAPLGKDYDIEVGHHGSQFAPNATVTVEVNGVIVQSIFCRCDGADGENFYSGFWTPNPDTIAGRVIDGNNTPVAAVTITDNIGHTTTTNSNGEYILTGEISAGTYTITPAKNGYTFEPPTRTVTVPPDATSQDFIAKSFSISGRVADENNNPVPNVTISDGAGHDAKTDDNGNYTVTGLITDTYTLTPVKGSLSFTPASLTVSVPPDVPDANFTVPDTDGDGLSDDWETYGVTTTGVFIDLPTMGANPRHKDLFVHADWMPGRKPSQYAMQIVVEAFRDAPVPNPDNLEGINLHIDLGPNSVMNYRLFQNWGDLSAAGELAFQQVIGAYDPTTKNLDWSAIDNGIKTAYFNPSQRAAVFHYMCFCNDLPVEFSGASGLSRGIGSSDFLVTLGLRKIAGGTPLQQAGTFMHELGHNLGLHHGGDNDVNQKPNYLSIMNYDFQFIGLLNGNGMREFDYSRRLLQPLNEDALDEKVGINDPDGHRTLFDRSSMSNCLGDNNFYLRLPYPALDWNCNGILDLGAVASNINGEPEKILSGHNDWPHIRFDGGGRIGSLGAAIPTTTAINEPSFDEIQRNVPASIFDAEATHPIGEFTTSLLSGTAPLLVSFDANTATDPDGTIVSWHWDFGDGTIGSGKTATHTYGTPGNYIATLTVYDNDGNTNLVLLRSLVTVAPGSSFIDTTPPIITPIITGVTGSHGWYTSDVTVTWEMNDPESGIAPASQCTPTMLTTETAGTLISCSATNGASIAHSDSVTIKIDKTAPSLIITSPQASVYHTKTVDIVWDADDTLTGLESTAAVLDGQAVTNGQQLDLFHLSTGTHTIIVTAVDMAGNIRSVPVTFTNSTRRQYLPLVFGGHVQR